MPTNPYGFREAREGGQESTVARSTPRALTNHNHFDGGQASVKGVDRPGTCPQGGGGIVRRGAQVSVARSRALRIAGVQATDLHAPLAALFDRRRVCSRNGLLSAMAELFGVTTGEIRIAVGLVQTLCRWRPIRPFGKEAMILHRFTLELSCLWHGHCLSGLKLRPE